MSFRNIVAIAVLLALALSLIPVSATSQADGGSYPHYDLLIIAPDEFVDEVEPLQRFKDASGRPTILLSLSEVYANPNCSAGADEPEKIKMCIAHFEQTEGIKYVMLVGDCDKFPVRYIRAYNTGWGHKYYPSDLYYADLYDGVGGFDDWDGDADTIVGEMDAAGAEDIEAVNLDDIDMHPDVAVARVPASEEPEVSTYVEKVIDYELRAPGDWFNRALLAVDGHVGPFGDTTKMNEDVVPHLGGLTIYKRYMDEEPWTSQTYADRASEISTRFNEGVGFANYYGHGNRFEWANKFEDGWYDSSYIAALTNQHKLPVIFASACYTGRFHFDRDYYRDVNNNEWNQTPPPDRPEPMAVQPSLYDRESLAEHFLVKNNGGGIAYIGCTSVSEHGLWLSGPDSVGLSPYFFEAYDGHDPGTTTLGDMWQTALDKFVDDVEVIAQYYYAFLHIHKMMIFGDPSLRVGGAFTETRSGSVWDDATNGPWKSYERYRITGDVTVPAGTTLTAQSASSVLFEAGRKITAPGSDPSQGFRMNGTSDEPAWFVSLASDPQSEHVVRGVKVAGQLRLRNGGQIKIH